PPALGLLQMPPAPRFIANPLGYEGWRALGPFTATPPTPSDSLFSVAKARGMQTALLGPADFHALHIDPLAIDVVAPFASDAPASVATTAHRTVLAANPKVLAVVARARGGGRADGARRDGDGPRRSGDRQRRDRLRDQPGRDHHRRSRGGLLRPRDLAPRALHGGRPRCAPRDRLGP